MASIVALSYVQSQTETHVYLYAFVGVAACTGIGYLVSRLTARWHAPRAGLTIFEPPEGAKSDLLL